MGVLCIDAKLFGGLYVCCVQAEGNIVVALPKSTFENANSHASLFDNSNKQAHGSSKLIFYIKKI